MPKTAAAFEDTAATLSDRIAAGFAAVREIVGRVWPYILGGIALGALIHGYVPEDFMASFMGSEAWWSVPLAVLKVLGTGCANCKNTIALIDQAAKAKGITVKLEEVEELRDIMGYGVMRTPGVVANGKVVHAGGVPGRDMIEHWLAA